MEDTDMYKQISHILENIQTFHGELVTFYEQMKNKVENERTKMMLDFVIKKERKHEECLKNYIETAPVRILNSWISDNAELPNLSLSECAKSIQTRSSFTVEDVSEITLKIDDCVIKIYHALENQTDNTDLKELFDCLKKKSKKQEMNFSRDMLWLNDL